MRSQLQDYGRGGILGAEINAAKRPYSSFQLSGAPSMPKITVSTIVKLIIACLLVGLVLSTLNVDPRNILVSGQATIEWLIEAGGESYLFDTGRGVLQRLYETGVNPKRIASSIRICTTITSKDCRTCG